MSNPNEIGIQNGDVSNYVNKLFDSIKEFYDKEKNYFYPVEGRERNIVFRIAHKLASKIEDGDIFVDCEANRCNGHSKIMPSNNILQKLIKTEFITPDLIIHKRNGKSYIAVEFKTSKRDMKHDYEKLAFLTADKGTYLNQGFPTYDLGVSILLGNDKIKEVKCFVKGEECKLDALIGDIYYRYQSIFETNN